MLEITFTISQLSDNDKELLKEYYGSDLKQPIINHYMPEELKLEIKEYMNEVAE